MMAVFFFVTFFCYDGDGGFRLFRVKPLDRLFPQNKVGSLMISQLYMWRVEDFRRAWYLVQEPLVMQARV